MNKPEFNDEFAKTRIRAHKTFGGKVVEILYGAKDADGNPCQPKEDAADGHGRWYGIEVDGDYRMFSWTHSEDEGGATEYGTDSKENALEDLEGGIAKKKELAREAEILARGEGGEETEEQMQNIQKEWSELKNWDTPVERDLQKRFDNAVGEYGPRQEAMKQNRTEKEAVVAKAEELKDSTNFRDARNTLRDLRNQLNEIGSAGASADEKFSKTLNELDRDLRAKQREYYDNLEANRAAAKVKKEEIIAKTRETVTGVTNWKDAGNKLNSLFDEWKAAGSAGHEEDENLWAQFNELRQQFRKGRQQFFDERAKKWEASIETKKKLIEEAKEISAKNDYGRANTDRMKELDKEWRAAGYSGKDQNDALWDEFNQSKEVFWDAKKNHAMKRIQSGIDAKQKELDETKKKIEDLEYRMEIAPNPAMKEDIQNELYLRKSELDQLQDEIDEEAGRLEDNQKD